MKFRYYIVSNHAGDVTGTNNPEVAMNYALDEDCYVIDSEDGTWVMGDEGADSSEIIEQASTGDGE